MLELRHCERPAALDDLFNFATITPEEMSHYSSAIAMESTAQKSTVRQRCGLQCLPRRCRSTRSQDGPRGSQRRSARLLRGLNRVRRGPFEAAEFFHVLFNGVSSSLLLTVGILSAYLYIALFATRANRERQQEQEILIEKLTGEFIMMQLLFVAGVVTACLGIWCVLIIKPVSKMSPTSAPSSSPLGLRFWSLPSSRCSSPSCRLTGR